MDTTCSDVLNLTNINCAGYNIKDLTGIRYFKALQNLYCHQNQLTILTDLPNSVKDLICDQNQITTITSLPTSLTRFSCRYNNLSSLPNLPSSIKEFSCNNNQLTVLPNLPNGLITIDCSHNLLTSLPAIPSSLYNFLACSNNQLTSLPTLPTIMNELDCDNNLLTSLPILPTNLFRLSCYSNKLTNLPALPNSLASINCSNNLLSILPTLPSNLSDLTCSYNQLTSLPVLPSAGMGSIAFDHNQIATLPNIPPLTYGFNCSYNLLTTIPTITATSSSFLDFRCEHNFLTALPIIPNSVRILYCGNNTISSINSLPSEIRELYCDSNLLSALPNLSNVITTLEIQGNSINCLPRLSDSLISFLFDTNLIKCLPNIPSGLTTSLPTCNPTNNPNNCPTTNPYVNIPDTNFAKFLIAKYPSCLYKDSAANKYYMDTTCGAVVSEDTLDCNHQNIVSLTGIEYFKNLKKLECWGNDSITTLPTLPQNLLSLSFSFTKVTSLTTLPQHLIFLNGNNTPLSSLPNLPDSLKILYLHSTSLTCLPLLPKELSILTVYGSNIKCIPNLVAASASVGLPLCSNDYSVNVNHCTVYADSAKNLVNIPDSGLGEAFAQYYAPYAFKNSYDNTYWLDTTAPVIVNETEIYYQHNPFFNFNIKSLNGMQYFKSLQRLDVSNNLLPSVDYLPHSLTDFTAENNKITSIVKLPNSLEFLDCNNNQLTQVSLSSPNLKDVFLENNKISQITQLSNKIRLLNLSNNLLTSLPALPNLGTLQLTNNSALHCLPQLPNSLSTLNIDTAIHCLPNIPSGLITTLTICNATNNPNNCPIFNPYVNIPDTNFGKFLITQYPSCLYKDASNLYWMDTTCSNVVNETTINCSYPNVNNMIGSFEGLQYFVNLFDFYCVNNNAYYIPTLSKKLQYLSCGGNKLTSLPILSDSLKQLLCMVNLLTQIPVLPSKLKEFDCGNNLLTQLLELPNSLTLLNCNNNNLTSLPNLPNTLELLGCGNNNIYCLPKLPYNLTLLYADFGTKINCIPNYFIGYNSNTHPNICNPTNNPNQCHIYPSVSGNVFTDNNSNSTKDALEFYRPFVKLSLNNGQTTYSNLQGAYGISVDTLGSYTLKVTPPPYFKAVPDSVTVNFTANTSVVLPDIALQPIISVDSFAIHITKLNRPRPGFNYAYNVSYGNVGTVSSANNNIVNVVYDTSKIHFDSASVAIQSNTYLGGNYAQVVVNAGSLVAGQGGTFNVYYTVKPTVPIGDSIKTSADISYAFTKTYDIDSTIVTGSFDPNDKQATPTLTPVQIQNGEYIKYTIRFQNTGNDTAVNIVVSDTLSNLLLYNNIQVVASSHSSNISYRLGNGIIYFEFLNINLPPTITNEPLSHGFVRFRVKALPTLATGVIIPNKAHIYFDYNQPIITNTATTQIKAIVTPVRMMSYELRIQNSKSEIQNNWQVGVEINVSHYVVQRSENGRNFTSVGEVAAQGLNNYSFTDKLPVNYASQTVYYRLKIVDKDGKVSYSVIRNLELGIRNGGISITPNPSKGTVNIDVANAKELLIIDYLGKVVKKQILNAQLSTINYQLAKGVYLVKVIMNNGEVKTSKLIIE